MSRLSSLDESLSDRQKICARTSLVRLLSELDFSKDIKNIFGEFETISGVRAEFPLFKLNPNSESSYVVSPYTQLILYAEEELHLLKSPFQERLAKFALKVLGRFFRWTRMQELVVLNSLCLSTNLYGEDQQKDLKGLLPSLVQRFPDSALLVRSLDERQHKSFLSELEELGFLSFVSRQVFYFDGELASFRKRSDVKKDFKLAKDSHFRWVSGSEISDLRFERIHQLYSMLYLEKHSRFNPQYSAEFFRKAYETRALEFHVLLDTEREPVALICFFEQDNILSTPAIGYDLKRSENQALYRRLFARALQVAEERRMLLNFSSGAGEFKTRRGGEKALEFCSVYIKHLSFRSRLGWILLSRISNLVLEPLFRQRVF